MLTWRCQPADVTWIKPLKDKLCANWVENLRDQPASLNRGSGAFLMSPPDRGVIANWISQSWLAVSTPTITWFCALWLCAFAQRSGGRARRQWHHWSCRAAAGLFPAWLTSRSCVRSCRRRWICDQYGPVTVVKLLHNRERDSKNFLVYYSIRLAYNKLHNLASCSIAKQDNPSFHVLRNHQRGELNRRSGVTGFKPNHRT